MKQDLSHMERYLLQEAPDGACYAYQGFNIVVSWGGGWDHVSVSRPSRCPYWDEMNSIKDLFFDPEECVVQYHPPKSEYKNVHKYCLHMWKPQEFDIPRPPRIMV